ncbi:MAG: hypothetical protein WC975_12885 [Phycisphaerae bacterium]
MKKIMKKRVFFALIVLCVTAPSFADMYGFANITNNGPINVASLLSVDVTQRDTTHVGFKFTNGSSSSICQIYFDDGTLLGISSIENSPTPTRVAFSPTAKPNANLPGGSTLTPPFEVSTPCESFAADADSPISPNGVTSGEWVHIIFSLQLGKTFTDTINALATGDLRIGLHVQSIGTTDFSDSFVNTPPNIPPVSAPAALVLGGIGLGFIGWVKKRFA